MTEAYITGIGQSEVGVRLERHPLLLTLDAVREALDESGLTIDQIDGVSTYPGRVPIFLGFSPVGADELIDALGIRATWHAGGGEISSQLGAVVAAGAGRRGRVLPGAGRRVRGACVMSNSCVVTSMSRRWRASALIL